MTTLQELKLFEIKHDVYSREMKNHLKSLYEEITLQNERLVRQQDEIERLRAKIAECPRCNFGE